jgi:hypothetical protein
VQVPSAPQAPPVSPPAPASSSTSDCLHGASQGGQKGGGFAVAVLEPACAPSAEVDGTPGTTAAAAPVGISADDPSTRPD